MKFISWNINGANPIIKNCEYQPTLQMFNADIYALQETKTLIRDTRLIPLGFNAYWSFHETSQSKYPQSGVVTLVKWELGEPKNVFTSFPDSPEFDTEGRLLVLEFENFYCVNVYVPQTQDEVSARSDGNSLDRRNYRSQFDRLFRNYMEKLDEDKTVIICGDFNAALLKIDMPEDSKWQDKKGFAKDANNQLQRLVKLGFSDTFRVLHPDQKSAYTHMWLNDKDGTKGRRLDYFFVSSDVEEKITEADIHANVTGSDHFPISLVIDLDKVKRRTGKIHHLSYEDLLERERTGIFFKDLKNVDLSHAWDTIDWKEVEKQVIYRQREVAIRSGTFDTDKINKVQYWYVRKLDSKVLAVRDTCSKKKHAGIDGIKWVTSNEKMHAALELTSSGYYAKPALARDIIDDNGKPRRINCDTYKDTAMQELYAASLAPVVESWSDDKSFANRLGRSTVDADYYIRLIYSGPDAPNWIVKTDVKKCYQSLSHDWCIKNVPMDKGVLIQFLKRDFFLDDRFHEIDQGIGLGSRLSPFLANRAMDGLQEFIYYRLNGAVDEVPDENNGNMIRFADDILVSARDHESAMIIQQAVSDFMWKRGMELSGEKTKLIFFPMESFDYLGRHYEKVGDRVKSYPSESAVTKFKRNIQEFLLNHKWSPESIVEELNQKIAKFANLHRMTDADEVFRELDVFICTSLMKMCDRYFGPEKKNEYMEHYFRKEKGGFRFFVKGAPHKKVNFLSETIWIKHRPLRLKCNPYIDLEEFEEHTSSRAVANMTGIYHDIWLRQEGCCAYCRREIRVDDPKEIAVIDATAARKEDRLGYIHSKCRNMTFVEDFSETEYTEDQNTLRMLVELMYEGVENDEELKENPLYQFFSDAADRTISINIKEVGELYGMVIDREVAKNEEYWRRLPGDRFGECWHRNNYFFNGFTTKNHTSVVFRKVDYRGG